MQVNRQPPSTQLAVAFGPDGTDPVGERLVDLADSLRDHGDPHVAIEVLDHTRVEFRLSMKVQVDPSYDPDVVLPAVRKAIGATYSFAGRDFGQPVVPSAVVAVAHGVTGVLAVDLDLLYTGATSELSDRLVAPAASVGLTGDAVAAGILVAAAGPFDDLDEMTVVLP